MRYREFPPSRALRKYVRHLWFFSKSGEDQGFETDRLLPEADSFLMFLVRGAYVVGTRRSELGRVEAGRSQPHRYGDVVLISGCKRAVDVECPGDLVSVGARLKPEAGRALGLFDPAAVSGPSEYREPWAMALLSAARELASMSGGDMMSLVGLLGAELERRASASGVAAAEDPAWDSVEEALARSSFRAGVDELAESLGLSARQFERVCRYRTGLTPIEYRNAKRCEAAANALYASDRPSLADLACATGFCDQAHFCNVFKAWSGMAPLRFHAACVTYRCKMRGPDSMRYRESQGRCLFGGDAVAGSSPRILSRDSPGASPGGKNSG